MPLAHYNISKVTCHVMIGFIASECGPCPLVILPLLSVTRDRLLHYHHLKMIKMDTKKKIVILSSLIMIVTDVVFIVLTYTTQQSDEQRYIFFLSSTPIHLTNTNTKFV